MGHERVGTLPKSKRWRQIVVGIGAFGSGEVDAPEIARKTLLNVSQKYAGLQNDRGVVAAFEFLLALAVATRQENPRQFLRNLGVELPGSPTPLALAKQLRAWVGPRSSSLEYRDLAQAAATDAIAEWSNRHKPDQMSLPEFHDNGLSAWRGAGTGAGFCEIARSFFASLTTRYLFYFLDREASSVLARVATRDRFSLDLEQHVQDISQHAFETARITQSFAAGWYNTHAAADLPSTGETRAFLAIALGKMRDELLVEAGK